MFMYIGLMLSDFGFATDKWYWQILIYILSAILFIIDVALAIVLSLFFYDDLHQNRLLDGEWRATKPF